MDQTLLWRRSLHLPRAESAVKLFLSTIWLCNTSITNTDSELTEDAVSRVSKSTMEGRASSYEAHVYDTTFNSWSEGQRKPVIFFKVVLKTLRKFSWLRLWPLDMVTEVLTAEALSIMHRAPLSSRLLSLD